MSSERYEALEKVMKGKHVKEFKAEVMKNRKLVKCTEFMGEFKNL